MLKVRLDSNLARMCKNNRKLIVILLTPLIAAIIPLSIGTKVWHFESYKYRPHTNHLES
jgi:hypothetical protein